MKARKLISIWLFLCAFLVICMIILGGYTRLSESGLSIVQWKPFSGVLPPMTEEKWHEEFLLYAQFPEFQEKNFSMTLVQFKQIYRVEYFHRLLGRLVGLVFLLPFLYFVLKKQLAKREVLFLAIVFFLGAVQGGLGWYMVKSGLVLDPEVSHYRLMAHMVLAILIYGLLIWGAMFFWTTIVVKKNLHRQLIDICKRLLFLCVLQIGLGAMVAGLNGGMVYNSFPLMNGHIIPREIWESLVRFSVFDNAVVMQFLHRLTACIIVIYSFYFLFVAKTSSLVDKKEIGFITVLCAGVCCQFILGVITLIRKVPIDLALAHQFFAIVVFTNLLFILHRLLYASEVTTSTN